MDEQKKVRLPHTREGYIWEAATGILILILWIVAAKRYMAGTGDIATHFDLAGKPNAYGPREALFIICGIATLAAALSLWCAYHPEHINLGVRLHNARQYKLAALLARLLAIMLTALFYAIILEAGQPVILIAVGIMVLIAIVFSVLARRAR